MQNEYQPAIFYNSFVSNKERKPAVWCWHKFLLLPKVYESGRFVFDDTYSPGLLRSKASDYFKICFPPTLYTVYKFVLINPLGLTPCIGKTEKWHP